MRDMLARRQKLTWRDCHRKWEAWKERRRVRRAEARAANIAYLQRQQKAGDKVTALIASQNANLFDTVNA